MAAQEEGQSRPTFDSVSQIVERVVWSGKPRLPEAQRALEVASLFEWFGLDGRGSAQLEYVASVAELSPRILREYLLSFQARGILTRRGDFAQVGPIPLAARLGLSRLESITVTHLAEIFSGAPEGLKASLLSRMRWLDVSPTAVEFARIVLSPDALGNLTALDTDFGAKTLDRLVHVAPDLAARTIDRVFGSLDHHALEAFRNGRRHLVWALEKLVFRAKTFDMAATLLRRLGAAEVEHWDDNAAGEFKKLYQLHLSGTEADPRARLLVLDDGLRSAIPAERALCVSALGKMLTGSHFSRTGGAEQIGSAEALVDWSPTTYGEIWDFYRAATERLSDIATSDDPLRETAKDLLGGSIRTLLDHLRVPEVSDMVGRVQAANGFWPTALIEVSSWLYFDREEADPTTAAEVRALYDELSPEDPVDKAVLFTAGWAIDLHDPDTIYRSERDVDDDHRYAERKAAELAVEIGRDEALSIEVVSRLASGDAKSAFAFAKQLALCTPDPMSLFEHALRSAERSPRPANRGVFTGLVAGADARDPATSAALVRLALASPKLGSEAIALIGAAKSRPDDLALAISLLASGDVTPGQSVSLSWGRGLDHLQPDEIMPLLQELERHGAEGSWSTLEILRLYRHGDPLPRVLSTWAKRILLGADLISAPRGTAGGHHLEQLVASLIEAGLIKKAYAVRLGRHLLGICRGEFRTFSRLDGPVRNVLGQLIPLSPEALWAEIAKLLIGRSPDVRHRARRLLRGMNRNDHLLARISLPVPGGMLLDWIRQDPATRAVLGVDWFPLTTKEADGGRRWTPELDAYVQEFADYDGVLASLSKRLYPTSFVGRLAPYLQPVVPLVEAWSRHSRASVRSWAAGTSDWLGRAIEDDRKRSEEAVVRYG